MARADLQLFSFAAEALVALAEAGEKSWCKNGGDGKDETHFISRAFKVQTQNVFDRSPPRI